LQIKIENFDGHCKWLSEQLVDVSDVFMGRKVNGGLKELNWLHYVLISVNPGLIDCILKFNLIILIITYIE